VRRDGDNTQAQQNTSLARKVWSLLLRSFAV
jgi:hypothetical protein